MPAVLEPETIETHERETLPSDGGYDIGNIYGKCPACGKPLRPRCKITGELKAPQVLAGKESRAKCDRCGAIIVYTGNGEWRVWNDSDLDDGGDPPGEP